MIRVFPVRITEATDVERNARGHRCSTRVWFEDWHHARRGELLHHAQDLFAPSGSLVLAPEDGVIVGSSRDTGPTPRGGHWLRLEAQREDGAAVRTYYFAHLLEAPFVHVGDRVRAGDLVGRVGRTGNASNTCPHLHLGARRYRRGEAINLYDELVAAAPTASLPDDVVPTPSPNVFGAVALAGAALLLLRSS